MKYVSKYHFGCTALVLEPTFSLIFTGELISAISLQVRILSVKGEKKNIEGHLEVLIPPSQSNTYKDKLHVPTYKHYRNLRAFNVLHNNSQYRQNAKLVHIAELIWRRYENTFINAS